MTEPGIEALALQSAKKIMLAFSGAYKKINLYSAAHSVYQDALGFFTSLLNEANQRFGTIRLHVERDRIIYNGETVYKAGPEPTDLAFILHRDGILSIEFQGEPELWEMDTFLKVLQSHCVLGEDAEDDIVTALWVLNLPSIAYEAAELEIGLENDLDFQELRCRPPAPGTPSDAGTDMPFENTQPHPPDHCGQAPEPRDEFFLLTPEERRQLDKMIAVEEELDGSDYVVDVLIYIIENHAVAEDIDDLLNHLYQAMQEAMLNLRFPYLHLLLGKLKKQITVFKSLNHWSTAHLERFCRTLSSHAFLNDLLSVSSRIETFDAQATKSFKDFLGLLDPSAITALATVMLQSKGDRMQRILLETITRMARRDLKAVENILFSQDKRLAARLVYILRFFNDSHSQQILYKLLKDESELVRRQALRIALVRKDRQLQALFALIDDPDKTIRTMVLEYLSREKNETTETLLLEYLKSGQAGQKDPVHFLEVCRTLGQCASERSLPFLKELLFKWPGLGILRFSNSVQHRGAAIALKEMNTRQAVDMLERAERGFFRNLLRSA
jgi:hypothetical protein